MRNKEIDELFGRLTSMGERLEEIRKAVAERREAGVGVIDLDEYRRKRAEEEAGTEETKADPSPLEKFQSDKRKAATRRKKENSGVLKSYRIKREDRP